MQCGHAVSAGFIFLCHSEVWWGSFPVLLRPQASPPKSKSGSYCTIAFYPAVSCLLCTIAETVGLSPAATPGAPFIPMGKDAMTPWIFVSKILQHRLSTCKKSAFSLPAVKDTCLFLTYAGEILLLPLPTVLDTYFRFLTTPGVRRGEKTFSTPYRNCCPLTSAGSLVTITGGPYSIGQGNRQSRHHHPRAPQDFPQPLL